MTNTIAIVGMACQYPDAATPHELWENVLSQRRAFRRMPAERLNLDDYWSPDRATPDRTYAHQAAVIEGYDFDRVKFRVVGSTFRSADLAHWLALDVASRALTDAGFPDGSGLPCSTTGVLLGNTLTGEFSRANVLRLRWPYVQRVLDAALRDEGWTAEQRQSFYARLEQLYKAPFPPIGEESLSGGLSNTIAGRICNYFDLHGGGYTIDGACSSSLLAISSSCSALVAGDLDVALAGGVDLSLDPFELIGFAKTGALASDMMRVYSAQSAGFWPGEGCGIVVLMREEDAIAQQRRIYATIRGWGISSDGNGGITRPEVDGQLLAIRRAYSRARIGIETVAYFEGHGTGTAVGDATELRALSQARREAANDRQPAFIGSIKANIGHTKAAAGVAGLIKATMALYTQTIPPSVGCEPPHPELMGDAPALRVSTSGQLWPEGQPLRAGVSSMGFGGINTHLVLEGSSAERRTTLTPTERMALMTAQDAELFVFSASDPQSLRQQVERVLQRAPQISYAEMADLAAELARSLTLGILRASVIAASPAELTARLETLQSWLAADRTSATDADGHVWLDAPTRPPRIGFLFPGQGSPSYLDGGALRRRFALVDELYANLPPPSGDAVNTAVAQPAIVRSSIAALRVLRQLDISAQMAVGHSLGELTALYWAGALDAQALLRVATVRGQAMAELGAPTGAMASIGADRQTIAALIGDAPVVIAGLNSPAQTVIAGDAQAVQAVVERARAQQVRATLLPVSHAFHSPLVEAAATPLAAHLATEQFRPPQRTVVSTVTGAALDHNADLRDLLYRQVTQPVRFMEASAAASHLCDLFVEVGPGQVLSYLVGDFLPVPALPIDAGGPSLQGLLRVVGAAFVKGAPVRVRELFADRLIRPFDLDQQPRFFTNPCELAPRMDQALPLLELAAPGQATIPPTSAITEGASGSSTLEVLSRLIAQRAELPPKAIRQEHHLLNDLHLNSISASQIVVEAARALGCQPPVAPTDYANATVGQVAEALDELRATNGASSTATDHTPEGVDLWIRPFQVALAERPRRAATSQAAGSWTILAPSGYPLAEALEQAFAQARHGQGIVVCLPPDPEEWHIGLLLKGAQKMLAERSGTFVVVQHGGGAAPLARTLHLEAPAIDTCVVDVPVDQPTACDWIVAEALAASGYTEAHYDTDGRRREPLLQLLPLPTTPEVLPLDPSDVLLVTGGGKGITAECALALAQETGAKLALLGRSKPDSDHELMINIQRMREAGLEVHYVAVDITDAEAVAAAVRECEAALGPISGILHGAARNEPQLIHQLDQTMIRRTFAPKVDGLHHLLASVDADRLRVLITFGSIIARTGLRGEADYALANDWLVRLTERFAAEHPACRCLAVEWSVWSGVGMGERLGRVAALRRDGITPIPPDVGIDLLLRLLARPLPTVAVVVTGRFGELPTLQVEQPELPLLRFLEQPQVVIGGVELIVDATLSSQTDPYLEDHVFRGERLLPAVMGMEAMAQAVAALTGSHRPPLFEDVELERPIVVPAHGSSTIRIAALVRQAGLVDVAIRSEETGFRVDHFRARCHVVDELPADHGFNPLLTGQSGLTPVPLDPDRDLYGGLFFHSGRFQRLRAYRQLSAKTCVADIGVDRRMPWFGRYLPQTTLLGDAGARDATLHTIQGCIPHAVILPIGVDRLVVYPDVIADSWISTARERSRDDLTFTYDVEVRTADGVLRERWEGLRLRIVDETRQGDEWLPALFGPYLERRLEELGLHPTPAVALELNAAIDRRQRGEQAIQRLLGRPITIHRRRDGKPLLIDGPAVSFAHGEPLTLAVVGAAPLACDLEPVQQRGLDLWQSLLGVDRFALIQQLVHATVDDESTAATRLWAAGECLIKAGLPVETRLRFAKQTADGWVLFASETLTIATVVVTLRGYSAPVVLAVLRDRQDVRERGAALAGALTAAPSVRGGRPLGPGVPQ
ncbi:MAG TPA: type I polyketide synthase [Herpetosiphonaceae bacterium]